MKNLPVWTYLDELTPIQNQWMEWYILPSCAVIFPQWARNQPKDFRLDYLLHYALEHQWELTPAGWAKAQELGLMDGREKQPIENDENWGISHGEAATRIFNGTFKQTEKEKGAIKTMLTRKVQSGVIGTNGKKGRKLRLSVSDVDALILKLRDDDLESDDATEEVRTDEEDFEDEDFGVVCLKKGKTYKF